ncbi:ABC transporter ATP-binding protein [Anaerolentibacter hominis]|uniref:ABC transporter ATP-binding protein n=1 Tax=Anaerolentibacter hominis TaxID=3079009 RepID=UPI0031B83251
MKLEVKEIYKKFGDKEILHGISFEAESGRALGLLGRNGAGKTTTMRILMDVFKSNGGEILLDGKPFVPSKHKIGYLPEERGLYPKRTVADQMIYLARLRGFTKSQAQAGMKKWLNRMEISEYENRKLETLSKGNQQKVQLAATLVCDPEIVILDEPFSGLDPVNSQILKDVVAELIEAGKIVIFSSHQMSYVEEFCDEIAIINHGDVALKGELKEIKKEYGKDRLILSAENYSLAELKEKLEHFAADLVQVESIKRDFLVLELRQGASRRRLLEAVNAQDIEIEHFGIYEPSLNDIFVARVGEESE